MANLMPTGKQQYFNNAGVPLSGGKIYTFEVGTTTPKATYSDAAGVTPNANPVILNSRGEALIFWDGVYDVQVKDANDNLIYSVSSYSASNDAASVSYSGAALDTILKSGVNKVVSSISALRAVDKTKYTQACVTGYYAAGDGGGGIYYYDSADTTSADNGGTVIVASDGGRWKLIHAGKVSVKQFGVKGDWNGTTGTDDTAALQKAFNCGEPTYLPPGCYSKITAALNATRPIWMEDNSYIHPTGSGYTALTIIPASGVRGEWRVRVGDGNASFTGNGIIFGDPATTSGYTKQQIAKLSANKCSGKGVEINNIWESTADKLEAYDCGNASSYALAIKSVNGDSSNTFAVQSIVVGQSDTKALYISAQHSCVDHIHVEQVFTPGIKFVHLDKCVRSSFGKVRVYNAGSAEMYIGSAGMTFDELDVSSNITFDHTGSLVGDPLHFGRLVCDGQISENSPSSAAAASCTISIGSGTLATLKTGTTGAFDPGARWDVHNAAITTLEIGKNAVGGRTKKGAEAVTFRKCRIANLSERQAGECAFTLDQTTVANASGSFSGFIRTLNSTFDGAVALAGDNASALNYHGHVYMDGVHIGGEFSTTGNVVGEIINSHIVGNMTASNGGTSELSICFKNTGCAGTVAAAFGAPPVGYDSDNGIRWGKGKRIDNIAAAVGSPKGWICTNSASNTWSSEGNL